MSATELVRRAEVSPFVDVDLSGVQTLAKAMFDAGVFPDVKSAAHAGVKIMAGAELGLGPVESMRSFHIIKGKVEFAAEFLAQRVRQHPHYDYEVLTLENDGCLIAFTNDGKRIGVSSFTDEDRELAGLELETTRDGKTTPTPWKTFPRNMMFARAMSNGVAWYMPDIVAGAPGVIDVVRPFSVLPDDDPADPTVIEIGKAAADTSSEEPGESGEDDTTGGGSPSPDAAPIGSRGNRGEVATRAEGSRDSEVELPQGEPGSTPGTATSVSPSADRRKATKAQLTKLAVLAAEHGWDDDERHARAGVASFTDLTKHAASVLIEAWSVDESPEGSTEGGSEPDAVLPADVETAPPPPGTDPGAPPSAELMRRARQHIGTDGAIVVLARKFNPGIRDFDSLTSGQVSTALEAFLRRKDCIHPGPQREDSGFCRRCGQMVGEPPT